MSTDLGSMAIKASEDVSSSATPLQPDRDNFIEIATSLIESGLSDESFTNREGAEKLLLSGPIVAYATPKLRELAITTALTKIAARGPNISRFTALQTSYDITKEELYEADPSRVATAFVSIATSIADGGARRSDIGQTSEAILSSLLYNPDLEPVVINHLLENYIIPPQTQEDLLKIVTFLSIYEDSGGDLSSLRSNRDFLSGTAEAGANSLTPRSGQSSLASIVEGLERLEQIRGAAAPGEFPASQVRIFFNNTIIPAIKNREMNLVLRALAVLPSTPADAEGTLARTLRTEPPLLTAEIQSTLAAEILSTMIDLGNSQNEGTIAADLLPAARLVGLVDSSVTAEGPEAERAQLDSKQKEISGLRAQLPESPVSTLQSLRTSYGDIFVAKLLAASSLQAQLKAKPQAIDELKQFIQETGDLKGALIAELASSAQIAAGVLPKTVAPFEQVMAQAAFWFDSSNTGDLAWIPSILGEKLSSTGADGLSGTIQKASKVHEGINQLSKNFALDSTDKWTQFLSKEKSYTAFVLREILAKGYSPRANAEHSAVRSYAHVSLVDIEKMYVAGHDPMASWMKKTEEGYQELFQALKSTAEGWTSAVIHEPFENGAKRFGYKCMFDYGQREKLSTHNAYFAFNKLISLYDAINTEAEQRNARPINAAEFKNKVLEPIVRDRRQYAEGSAHDHLNTIVQSINPSFEDTYKKAGRYRDIPSVGEYLDSFQSPSDVLTSWDDLKRWADFSRLVQTESVRLDKLVELREQGVSEATLTFIGKLAFDRESKVDLSSTLQMVEDPTKWLANNKDPVGDLGIKTIQPIEYTKFSFLDLTPNGLVEAFTAGRLETAQVFRPFAVEYLAPADGRARTKGQRVALVREGLDIGIGSKADGRRGEAQNPSKLFAAASKVFDGVDNNQRQEHLRRFLKDPNSPITERQLDRLEALTFKNGNVGLPLKHKLHKQNDLVRVRVVMQPKSSTDGVKAGNDTACCMPWGSAKMTNYTFNNVTGILTVQIETAEGKFRTMAQSVVTLDQKIGQTVSRDLPNRANATQFHEFIESDAVSERYRWITCDNVEVAKNYITHKNDALIKAIYADFFHRYHEHHQVFFEERNISIDPHQVLVGVQYGDALKDSVNKETNSYLPTAPVAYSDNVGDKVGIVTTGVLDGATIVEESNLGGVDPRPGPVQLNNLSST